jgi:hypothetical protein
MIFLQLSLLRLATVKALMQLGVGIFGMFGGQGSHGRAMFSTVVQGDLLLEESAGDATSDAVNFSTLEFKRLLLELNVKGDATYDAVDFSTQEFRQLLIELCVRGDATSDAVNFSTLEFRQLLLELCVRGDATSDAVDFSTLELLLTSLTISLMNRGQVSLRT